MPTPNQPTEEHAEAVSVEEAFCIQNISDLLDMPIVLGRAALTGKSRDDGPMEEPVYF